MSTKTAALVFGVVFAVVGFLGFMPSPPPPDAPPLSMEHGHGLALGLFPVNTLHNVVHLLFAVLGIAAWAGGWARSYFQFLTVAYGLLAVLGLIPATSTTFGFIRSGATTSGCTRSSPAPRRTSASSAATWTLRITRPHTRVSDDVR